MTPCAAGKKADPFFPIFFTAEQRWAGLPDAFDTIYQNGENITNVQTIYQIAIS
jgi:hypothetical protein